MDPTNAPDTLTPLDQATARRLARLGTMPVDTRTLDNRLAAVIPPSPRVVRTGGGGWMRPLRAMAAGLLIVGLLGALVYNISSAPAQASVALMAQMHEDLVSGKTPAVQVDSIDAANRELSRQCPDSPALPNVPQQHVMACCMKSVKNKRVACVLLKSQDVPVTLTVANASDIKLPESPGVEHAGATYHVQSTGKLNMVTTRRNQRWICLIGQVPPEQLMDLSAKLQF
jgi:hypothetical protein